MRWEIFSKTRGWRPPPPRLPRWKAFSRRSRNSAPAIPSATTALWWNCFTRTRGRKRRAENRLNRAPLFHHHAVVLTLPAILLRPEEGEANPASHGQRSRGQVERMDAQARVAGVRVDGSLPAVDAPVHQRWIEQHDAQLLVARQRTALVVEPPAKDLPCGLLDQITLHGLRRLVKNLSVAQRTPQLHVLGMSPYQRTSRAGRLAAEKFHVRDIVGIPDLLGEQAT